MQIICQWYGTVQMWNGVIDKSRTSRSIHVNAGLNKNNDVVIYQSKRYSSYIVQRNKKKNVLILRHH